MLNATTAEEVFDCLSKVVNDPKKYKIMGETAYDWFMKYAINGSVDFIKNRIANKNLRKNKIGFPLYFKIAWIDFYVGIIVLLNKFKIKSQSLFPSRN